MAPPTFKDRLSRLAAARTAPQQPATRAPPPTLAPPTASAATATASTAPTTTSSATKKPSLLPARFADPPELAAARRDPRVLAAQAAEQEASTGVTGGRVNYEVLNRKTRFLTFLVLVERGHHEAATALGLGLLHDVPLFTTGTSMPFYQLSVLLSYLFPAPFELLGSLAVLVWRARASVRNDSQKFTRVYLGARELIGRVRVLTGDAKPSLDVDSAEPPTVTLISLLSALSPSLLITHDGNDLRTVVQRFLKSGPGSFDLAQIAQPGAPRKALVTLLRDKPREVVEACEGRGPAFVQALKTIAPPGQSQPPILAVLDAEVKVTVVDGEFDGLRVLSAIGCGKAMSLVKSASSSSAEPLFHLHTASNGKGKHRKATVDGPMAVQQIVEKITDGGQDLYSTFSSSHIDERLVRDGIARNGRLADPNMTSRSFTGRGPLTGIPVHPLVPTADNTTIVLQNLNPGGIFQSLSHIIGCSKWSVSFWSTYLVESPSDPGEEALLGYNLPAFVIPAFLGHDALRDYPASTRAAVRKSVGDCNQEGRLVYFLAKEYARAKTSLSSKLGMSDKGDKGDGGRSAASGGRQGRGGGLEEPKDEAGVDEDAPSDKFFEACDDLAVSLCSALYETFDGGMSESELSTIKETYPLEMRTITNLARTFIYADDDSATKVHSSWGSSSSSSSIARTFSSAAAADSDDSAPDPPKKKKRPSTPIYLDLTSSSPPKPVSPNDSPDLDATAGSPSPTDKQDYNFAELCNGSLDEDEALAAAVAASIDEKHRVDYSTSSVHYFGGSGSGSGAGGRK